MPPACPVEPHVGSYKRFHTYKLFRMPPACPVEPHVGSYPTRLLLSNQREAPRGKPAASEKQCSRELVVAASVKLRGTSPRHPFSCTDLFNSLYSSRVRNKVFSRSGETFNSPILAALAASSWKASEIKNRGSLPAFVAISVRQSTSRIGSITAFRA